MSAAGTEVDRGGMGRGTDDSPPGNEDPKDPATRGSPYDILERWLLFDPQWQAFSS